VRGGQGPTDDFLAKFERGMMSDTTPVPGGGLQRYLDAITPLTGLVTAILGGLTTLSGDFTAVIRDQTNLLWAGIGCLIVGFAITIWAFIRISTLRRRQAYLVTALFAFALSFVLTTGATVNAVSDRQGPNVSLVWNDTEHQLTGEVVGRNMAAPTRVRAAIQGIFDNGIVDAAPIWSSIGAPAMDGTLTIPVAVAISPDEYRGARLVAWVDGSSPDCHFDVPSPLPGTSAKEQNEHLRQSADPWACAEVDLPFASSPVVNAHLATVRRSSIRVTGTASATLVMGNRLFVLVSTPADGRQLFAVQTGAASDGVASVRFSVPVPQSTDSVCVTAVAEMDDVGIGNGTGCPADRGFSASASWIQLDLSRQHIR
jgi:hypothetical protein